VRRNLAVFAGNSWAALTITAQGAALGFTLTKFVTDTGNPSNSGFSPLEMTVFPNGNVLVLIQPLGKNFVWPDVDGQNLGSAITSSSFAGCCPAYATAGGAAWGSQSGNLVKFDNNGAVVGTFPSAGVNITNGMCTNPLNGHLLAGSGAIYDITIAGGVPISFRTVTPSGSSDGISVSPDGTTVYTNIVTGYNILNGNLTFGPISIPGGPDGTGVISSNNNLNGDVIVNTNSGTVVLIDIHKQQFDYHRQQWHARRLHCGRSHQRDSLGHAEQ
jgi:hypothetical protein